MTANPKTVEIEIFSAGTRPASNGVEYTITAEDLREVVDSFNPKVFRPPLIVSHDTGGIEDKKIADKELCYGVPKYLKLVGATLKAGFDKVAPQMVDWVKSGMLHSVSSSFYLPNSPNNPYPGKMSLRHIAALGATPPAVKGLKPLEFNVHGREEGVVEFIMGISAWTVAADLFQRFREYLIEKESLDVAEKVLPADQIAQLRSMADSEQFYQMQIADLQARISDLEAEEEDEDSEEDDGLMAYGEADYMKAMKSRGMTTADVAKATGINEDDLKAIASGSKKPSAKQKKTLDDLLMAPESTDMSERFLALEAREKAVQQKEQQLEKAEVASFVETLVKQGKIIAAKRDDTITLLLNTSDSVSVDFSEEAGGAKSPRKALMDMLNDQPSWNYGEEIVTPLDTIAVNPDFSAPAGFSVDKRSAGIYRKAMTYCVTNKLDPNNMEHWQKAVEFAQGGINA